MLRRTVVRCTLGCGLLLSGLALQPAICEAQPGKPGASVTQAEIDAAVKRARVYLEKDLPNQMEGSSTLGALALLKSGTLATDPTIQQQVRLILNRFNGSNYTPGTHHIYGSAVDLMVLANTDKKLYSPQITGITQHILKQQSPDGHWHYTGQDAQGDTSISQYAMLGLWEAQRSGVEIPLEVWDRAAGWHIRTQQADGGFSYHPTPNNIGINTPLHSMTAAGIGSLHIARKHLYPDSKELVLISEGGEMPRKKRSANGLLYGMLEPLPDKIEGEPLATDTNGLPLPQPKSRRYTPQNSLATIDAALNRATRWMTQRFTVTNPTGYHIYFLYGLERGSSLANRKTYGDKDWYREGSTFLVRNQVANGGWIDQSGGYNGGAFGILFLVKATEKMIHRGPPRVEFGAGILVGGRGLPEDLTKTELADGKVKTAVKPKSSLEELLAVLEKTTPQGLETAQTELIEQVTITDKAELIGQAARLKTLAAHPQAEVRRTAMWAIGRCENLGLAPLLIRGLADENLDVFIEARNALRCLSRAVDEYSPVEQPLDKAARQQELENWQQWYLQVRPYQERNDLPERKPRT